MYPRRALAADQTSGTRLTIRIVRGPARDPDTIKRLILADPGILEDRLRVLDGHLRSGDGDLIDLLAMDRHAEFVLIEIDRGDGESLVSRILRHRQWIASQFLFLRKLYGAGPITAKPPRVIVLSEQFENKLLEALGSQGPGVRALTYRILLTGGGTHLYLEAAQEPLALPVLEELDQSGPPAEEEPVVPMPEHLSPERLSEEEWEAFYEFERRRLAAERAREQVKA
ncbi:MAG TPA: hypothetical protein VFW45_04865 [Candidatus Polarisedimenticolia bacterium]|nr:hypothetical protein [Candidatus Polarisedimenticolia bacterium]